MSTQNEPQGTEPKEKSPIWLYILLGAVVLFLLIDIGSRLLQLVVSRLQAGQPAPAPTVAVDDSWGVVQRSGVLLVGTSADYPPFSYTTDGRNLDGFDIALAYEIGKKLGVQVNIQNIPFDNLFPALQNSQFDAAMAAISITPEREQQVSFSNVYYVGSDGILAQKGSPITSVKTPQDMSNKRIGVERNTVYQTWVQTSLVNTGLISSSQMFVYATAEDAVTDLSLGRLDLVMLDLQPAIALAQNASVVLVGQGLDIQRMAIAFRPGSDELIAKVNDALAQLQNEGILAALQMEYLNLSPSEVLPPATATATLIPTATSVPTATSIPWMPWPPPPPPGCVNAMQYIKDLTYDDGNNAYFPDVHTDTAFTKGWRIRNTGSCTWNTNYYLKFVRGTRMGGDATYIDRNVYPGQTYDIYVDLVSPSTEGRYSGEWRLFNDDDAAFGDSLWVSIETIYSPTRTPTPTRTATPVSTSSPMPTYTYYPTYTPFPPTYTYTPVPPTYTYTPTETPTTP